MFATGNTTQHACRHAAAGRSVQGQRLTLAEWGQESAWPSRRCPASWRCAPARQRPAVGRRPRRGQLAHDRADGGAHRRRWSSSARRALGVVQHLPTQDQAAAAVVVGRPETARSPTRVFRSTPEGRDAGGVLVVHAHCARPDGSGPTLLVDDGGDATLYIHKGASSLLAVPADAAKELRRR